MTYASNLCQALSRAWNALRGEPWYMSICASEYRKMLNGEDNLVEYIDTRFKDPNHCKIAHEIALVVEDKLKELKERKHNEATQ